MPDLNLVLSANGGMYDSMPKDSKVVPFPIRSSAADQEPISVSVRLGPREHKLTLPTAGERTESLPGARASVVPIRSRATPQPSNE